jgi:DNA repair protein RadA
MSEDGGTLESLQDVDHHLVSKLQGVGIQSISDLATTTASEILEDYYSNYDEGARGIDIETLSRLIIRAKQKLIEDDLLQKEFSTAEKMLELRKKLIRFTTGSQSFDSFLGGVESRALTEIAGEFGSGKSQICYTLCVTVNIEQFVSFRRKRQLLFLISYSIILLLMSFYYLPYLVRRHPKLSC